MRTKNKRYKHENKEQQKERRKMMINLENCLSTFIFSFWQHPLETHQSFFNGVDSQKQKCVCVDTL